MIQNKKLKVLAWSDSVLAATGFGTVSKHTLSELYNTGKYEIDQLAINYYGDFYDRKKYPYQIVPARLLDPNDPFGNEMLIRNLQKKDYDILWVLNDTFVVNKIAPKLEALRAGLFAANRKPFKIIYYYPVDCAVIPHASKMIELADASVCITKYGQQETYKALPNLNKEIDVIYHGCDIANFNPVTKKQRRLWRLEHLGVKSDDTYVVLNVNRNSVRKDIARSILAFKKFREHVPNSVMYIHCQAIDNNIDLTQVVRSLGLSTGKDVLFPADFQLHKGGFPVKALNMFYNAADLFFTTTLGEGWGLTTTEAMSVGLPVLAPDNTSASEILGEDRGYLIPATEKVWIDNQGFRPWCTMDDIMANMLLAYSEWKQGRQETIIKNAFAWAHKYTWHAVSQDWVTLFDRTLEKDYLVKPSKVEEV